MKGNEAFAAAAINAGCRYYFGYPITPQSEVPEYMSRELKKNGGAFKKLRFAQKVYKAGLMSTALTAYRFMIEKMHIDIKW